MSARLNPSIRATLVHRLFPESEGTVTRRYATRGLADAGAFSQGRVYKFGTIVHRTTRPDGSYSPATGKIELGDEDGFFRGLVAASTTRNITGCELTVEILSEAGRAAGTPWRPLIRGPVTDMQCPPGRRAVLECTDSLGAQFSWYDLDKTIGEPITRAIIPRLPEKSINRIFPIVTGEWSDIGSKDANGNPNDKGKLPFVDGGWVLLGEDGSFAPEDGTISTLPAPAAPSAVVTGTPATRTRRYGITAFSAIGETTLSTELSVVIPDSLGGGNDVELTWDAVSGSVSYGVYVDGHRATTVTAVTWTDTGLTTSAGAEAPTTNGALIEQVINGVPYGVWRMLIRKIGAGPDVHHVYGSDLAEGTAPKRIRLPESVYGPEILVYGRPGWPHANSYIEMGGIRFSPMYARGPRAEHHINGTVTFAWNGCGDPGATGTDSDPTITEAFFAWQHVLNTYGFMNRGAGYKTGDWGTLETFEDGTAIIRTSKVQAAQALSATWIGGRGYQASIAIFTPISLREFDRRFRNTFAAETTSQHFGQIYQFLIDDTADPTVGRLYHDKINVVEMESQDTKHAQVVTRQIYHFDWDEDAQAFKQNDLEIHDTVATAQNWGRPREAQPRSCYYSADFATVYDAMARHVMRYSVAPREVGIRTDLTGLEDEAGAQIICTLMDGAGGASGDVNAPFLVLDHEVDPSRPGAEGTVLTIFALKRLLDRTFPLAGDKALDPLYIGDKSSTAAPPVGAYLAG